MGRKESNQTNKASYGSIFLPLIVAPLRHDFLNVETYSSVQKLVASPIADPGVESSIPARSHTFMEIDKEIFSMVILLPKIQEGGQLQAKVCPQSIGLTLRKKCG